MKMNIDVNHARITRQPGFCFFIALFFIAIRLQGQDRAADLIVTFKKDTLSVKITEVGLMSLTYRNFKGDTAVSRTIPKNEVRKVFFGNGDVEEFNQSQANYSQVNDPRYYKMAYKTSFQKEISAWQTDRLLEKKELYGQRYAPQKAVGITTFVVGGGFVVVGFIQAFASIFTLSDELRGGVPIAIGLGVSTGIGMPFTILGIKNKRKYKAITMELNRRGI
ncbi:hypothetical protein [Dyadobacter sp. 32]|uniref:hypothetical protein n=1 Tax=Dyadobacter sp. 32 TaxID=538966 RepID=UPI0011EDFCC6